jgi:hypothetical protein
MAQAARKTSTTKASAQKIAPVRQPQAQVDKLFDLRANVIAAGSAAEFATRDYISALNRRFGTEWPTFDGLKASEIGDNLAAAVTAYKAEKATYYAAFRSNHAAKGKKGEANPSVYWANFKKLAKKMAGEKTAGSGNKLTPLAAMKRDLPGLYIRINNSATFEANEKEQRAATLLGQALALILTPQEMQALNEKIGG